MQLIYLYIWYNKHILSFLLLNCLSFFSSFFSCGPPIQFYSSVPINFVIVCWKIFLLLQKCWILFANHNTSSLSCYFMFCFPSLLKTFPLFFCYCYMFIHMWLNEFSNQNTMLSPSRKVSLSLNLFGLSRLFWFLTWLRLPFSAVCLFAVGFTMNM